MATASFDKASIEARKAATPEVAKPETAIVPAVDAQIVTEDHAASLRGEDNEFDSRDINIPYISLVQKTSDLIDQLDGLKAGAFVFNKGVILSTDGKTPINVIIAELKKTYAEDLAYESDEIAQKFNTIAEARAAGFDEEYGAEKRVIRRADFTFLIQAPAGLNDLARDMFPFTIGGNHYALGKFTARKGAYATTAKVAISLHQMGSFLERNGLKAWHHGSFALTSVQKHNEKNTWYQPVLKAAKKTSDEVVEFIETVLKKS